MVTKINSFFKNKDDKIKSFKNNILSMKEKCLVKRCRNIEDIVYLGFSICELHWIRHCDEDDCFDLRKELNLSGEENEIKIL